MRQTSNNLVAGLFVISGIVGFVLIVLTLSGVRAWGGSRVPYTIRFDLREGASGLKSGSTVRVGGQNAGTVTNVQYLVDDKSGAPIGVDVVVAIDPEIVFYKDAVVQLELPLLGTVSTMNFPFNGTAAAGKVEPGGVIEGMVAPPPFMSQLGFGDEQRTQMQQILASGAKVISKGEALVDQVSSQTTPLLKDVADAAADVKAITADTRKRLDTWAPKIDSALSNVDKLTLDAQASRKLVDDGLNKAKEFIDSLQAMLRDNRPRIDNVVKNADELVAKANGQLVDQVQALLEDGRKGLREFSEAGQRVNSLVAEASPEVRLIAANARLSSDQLKLLMTEVRRNPWRLLYTPGKKEVEQELLFDASRNYASAVSDLRGVSASLEAAAAASANDPAAQQRLNELRSQVSGSYEKYKQAEDAFLKMLTSESK